MVTPVNHDADSGRSLLEREESALTRKRQAINAGAKSLEALRRATTESREALQTLRDLGFSQRELTDAFGLTRDEVTQLFPRRPRSAGPVSATDLEADFAVDSAAEADETSASADRSGAPGPGSHEELGAGLDEDAQQPGQKLQAR